MPRDVPRRVNPEVSLRKDPSRDLLAAPSNHGKRGEQKPGGESPPDKQHKMPLGESNQPQGRPRQEEELSGSRYQEQPLMAERKQEERSSLRNQSDFSQAGHIRIGDREALRTSRLQIEHTPKDGELVVVMGNPREKASWNLQQGKNVLNETGTCSLGASRTVLSQHGITVKENDLFTDAMEMQLLSGETGDLGLAHRDIPRLVELLGRYEVAAEYGKYGGIETIKRAVEQKSGMIIMVEAGTIDREAYSRPNSGKGLGPNHAVAVVGLGFSVKEDAANTFWYNPQRVDRIYIADSGTGKVSSIPVTKAMLGWQMRGGEYILTEPFQ